jgi:hypothetical protein
MIKTQKPREFTMDDRFPKDMTFDVLLSEVGLMNREVIVTLIKPLRQQEYYTKGRLTGFKSGLWGGGHYNYRNGVPMSFDSQRIRCIKKPKVHVTYDIFDFGGRMHSDWVDIDNCTFQIIKK